MMHTKRVWCVSPVLSAEDLAEKLTNHSWTLCTGMGLGGYLFLNDATSEDGAEEYAVVKLPDDRSGFPRQVESITFGWCDYEKALSYIRRALAGEFDGGGTSLPGLRVETPETHDRCRLCM